MRAEGLSELIESIVLQCTGGDPTPPGQPVPKVNVTVRLNTNVGGIFLPNSATDAVLSIDNPSAGNQVVQDAGVTVDLTGVGDDGIFYNVPSSPVNAGQRVPNLFQGRHNGRNSIAWLGVPVDPPGTTATRIIRIKNVRADANLLARSAVNSLVVTLSAPGLGIDNATLNYGPIALGLTHLGFDSNSQFFTQASNAGIYYTNETLNRNVPAIPVAERIWTLQLGEGAADAFRTRYGTQGTIGDPFADLTDQQAQQQASLTNVFRGSETGYLNRSSRATNNPANYGTRIGVRFFGVPSGVDVYLSALNRTTSESATVSAAALTDCVGPAQRAASTNGMIRVPIVNGAGVYCAEIFRQSPTVRERLFFDGYYSFDGSGTARPPAGLVTVSIFLAPTAFYPPSLYTPNQLAPLYGPPPDPYQLSVQTYSLGRFLADSSAPAAVQVSRITQFQNGILSILYPNAAASTNIQLVPSNAPVSTTITPVVNPPSAERQITAGWLSVTPSQGSVPLTLNLRANPAGLAPGTYTGGVRIQTPPPSAITNLLPVSMLIPGPGPRTAPNGVVGAADYFAGAVTAGQAIVVFGAGYGPPALARLELDGEGRVAKILAGTRVLFDGDAAPMIYAVNGQVSAFVPFSVAGRTSTVMNIEYRGVLSPPVYLRVVDAIPGLFTANESGAGQGAILNQNGSVNSALNPVQPGEVIVLYGTGAGQTSPPGTDGRLAAAPLPELTQAVRVLVDGEPIEVLYAGPAPGLAEGVLQVNARLSPNTRRGRDADVLVTVGDYRSQPGVTVAIAP